ncbi:MAG: MFS transporter [Eggerthellaceae bacterium]|nr:MFS transporter [Eggerthellaceae bacterium]
MKPRTGPFGFILSFGVVSMLMDVVYQAALSVQGPLLASLGASAALVGLVSGLGEATSLAGRLVSGPAADRTGRYWVFAIAGYAITGLAVPAMGFAGSVVAVSALIIVERFGKSLRTPSRDAMISHASAKVGRGKGFAIHELMDQVGAFAGPLVVAAILQATHNSFGSALGVMIVPGVAAILVLLVLRRRVPDPSAYEEGEAEGEATAGANAEAVAPRQGVAGANAEGRALAAAPVKQPRAKLPARFWAYTSFCGLVLAGVGTFGVMSFHMVDAGLMDAAFVPVLYAIAQAVDAVFALITGSLYDKYGVKVLFVLPAVSALVPLFAFASSVPLVAVGVALWGMSLGVQESTMRAAVADMVPGGKRATSYGMFSVATGIGTFVGATVIGVLYPLGQAAIAVYAIALQVAAFILLARLVRRA